MIEEKEATVGGLAASRPEALEADLHRHIHLENNILLRGFDNRSGEAPEDEREDSRPEEDGL